MLLFYPILYLHVRIRIRYWEYGSGSTSSWIRIQNKIRINLSVYAVCLYMYTGNIPRWNGWVWLSSGSWSSAPLPGVWAPPAGAAAADPPPSPPPDPLPPATLAFNTFRQSFTRVARADGSWVYPAVLYFCIQIFNCVQCVDTYSTQDYTEL